jgi:hypothetical protein
MIPFFAASRLCVRIFQKNSGMATLAQPCRHYTCRETALALSPLDFGMCATGSASVCSANVVQNRHWQSQWHPNFWL